MMFFSLVVFHHLAGLSETYLDYSNATYTIFLCYGLALHSPIKRYWAKLTEKINYHESKYTNHQHQTHW